jgi:beta-lactamase superfamily II metal-dependent hydrolase
MSIIKSFSVGNGDMFYINHDSDNFTVIDCCMKEDNKNAIMDEIKSKANVKGIQRFISTHPDEDHILGLQYFNQQLKINSFYCVQNSCTKKNETTDFKEYCTLRDSKQVFYIYKGRKRKWMNVSDDARGSAGISILWPDKLNQFFNDALKKASKGESPNNISPIIQYSLENGVKVLWMGDLETDFMNNIESSIKMPDIDILFAPHHGRDSGKIPESWLKKITPKIIVIGEAPSEHLNYYKGYNTITQNSAGNIIFDCQKGKVHIYVSTEGYSVKFLKNEKMQDAHESYYLGTLYV